MELAILTVSAEEILSTSDEVSALSLEQLQFVGGGECVVNSI